MISNFLRELGLKRGLVAAGAASLTIWVALIIASGAGWNPFPAKWDFSNPGAFGDSFGPLSAFMASLAALGAIAAYRSQSDELKRIRDRDQVLDEAATREKERTISREFLADERIAKQSFESTFFQLLEVLRGLVTSLDIEIYVEEIEKGHDAFKALLNNFKSATTNPYADIGQHWTGFSNKYKNDLNHYFRLLYHIVKFVKQSEIENKYFYIQLLRSMLSDSELALLALNCEYGHGREKFKALIEEFALLHNLSQEEQDHWNLRDKFSSGAFEYIRSDMDFEYIESEISNDATQDSSKDLKK